MAGLMSMMGGGGMGTGSPADMSMIMNMMEDPAMQTMMQQVMSSPGVMEMMINSNPQLSAMIRSNPMMGEMMRNPEFMRSMLNPQVMQAAMRLQQNMGAGGLGALGAPGGAGAGGMPDMSALMAALDSQGVMAGQQPGEGLVCYHTAATLGSGLQQAPVGLQLSNDVQIHCSAKTVRAPC